MRLNLYNRFIRSSAKEPDRRAREVVLNYLLAGMIVLSAAALIDTLAVFMIARHGFLLSRILSNAVTVLLLLILYRAARYPKLHAAVAFALLLFIAAAGSLVAYQWGVLNSNSLLLFSLAVVMAGVLISARFSLYVAIYVVAVLAGLEYIETQGISHPNLSWLDTKPTLSDIIGFSVILLIIASVSWLFNRQMEQALRRARRSERALEKQKVMLEIKVRERTEELEASQLEQLQELYRFAELGRLSTALFHDLANHLTNVSIDIEGLARASESDIMQRIQKNVRHIDSVVKRVRQQIQGKTAVEVFDVTGEITEVTKLLSPTAASAGVTIKLETDTVRPGLLYRGDILRFRQIILNTLSNGIEAYGSRQREQELRTVTVRVRRSNRMLLIDVADRGVGVAHGDLRKIFEPFYSTKAKGLGIGLFIVKQVVEQDFGGTIDVESSSHDGTVFHIKLPKSYYAKPSRT